jgi:hypothetical protein
MEGGSLFNPGFLGSNFSWWVGQIADDSTWRDNIKSGKYESKNDVPGWGRRYKVRIIGLHDQGQEAIPDDQLPWANVMYPITGGGGQTESGQTANLRQGNMVFGFFLDGQDQQVPVIMGVLGNNSQTELNQKIGTNRVTNAKGGSLAQSGYSDGAVAKSGTAKEVPPDEGKGIEQPPPGKSGAANENVDGVHQITAADTKRQAKCDEKIVLMKADPQELIPSALKGIQTAIDNLVTKIDSYLQAIQSYVDTVSNTINNLQTLMRSFACEIAKYMKVIFDKIMEFVLKTLNKALTKVVAALPSSLRSQFSDMKQVFTDLIRCLYSKMTAGLCDKVLGALTGAIDIPGLVKEATDRATKGEDEDGYPSGATTNPYVPMCTAETITAQVLAGSKPEIESANNNLVDNLNSYLDDVTDTLAGVTGILGDVKNLIPDISGSVTSALSFTNIKLNVFGCEVAPNIAASDFYTFCQGGGSQSPAQLPSSKSVDNKTAAEEGITEVEGTPFVEPTGADRGTQPKVGDQVTDPEVIAAIEEEREIGRTGQLPPITTVNPETSEITSRPLTAAEQAERQASIDSLEIQ